MSTEGEEQERLPRSFWTWGLWVGCAGLLYVLSTGPVVRLEAKGYLHGQIASSVISVVYFPMEWAYRHTALQQPIRAYLCLWAPEYFGVQRH